MTALGLVLAAAAEGAEPSKTAFYVAGAILAAFAVIVGGVGVVSQGFPRSPATARFVAAIAVLLVAATLTTSVLTA